MQVAVSVLGAAESEARFGAPLARKGIQPVWLEVTNSGPQEFILILLSIDPDYFSPSEVAWQAREPGEQFTPEILRCVGLTRPTCLS